MRILSVVGARPQFVKLAPIHKAAKLAGVEHVVVHTGQHYDPMLSDVFFEDLEIGSPDIHLGVGSGSHGVQTGAMLAELDRVFEDQAPDWVLVYGDTNSTVAAALSAAKLQVKVAHLEAGLRSFNRRMPEEHNRIVTDHLSDLLLAPTALAVRNLERENLGRRTICVGDVMVDVLHQVLDSVSDVPSRLLADLSLNVGEYYLATIHRPDNTDDPARLTEITNALSMLDKPVVLLAHPRLVAKASAYGIELNRGQLISYSPLAYPDLVSALISSAGIVTDSGGLQKEAFQLRVPCTTVRPETEWVETIDLGWNQLANSGDEILLAVQRPLPHDTVDSPYGDGKTAERVIRVLEENGT